MKFPKIPEGKADYFYQRRDFVVAVVKKKEMLKLYYWDRVSAAWNYSDVYELTDMEIADE